MSTPPASACVRSSAWGRSRAWSTWAVRPTGIIPLGPQCFLEILGIGDTSKSDGAWLAAALQGQDRVLWWCLGVNDLDDSAERRGLPIRAGQARTTDADELVFRSAGIPQYPLPFFFNRAGDPATRARVNAARYEAAGHTCAPTGYTFVEVGDFAPVLDGWLGPGHPHLRYRNGRRGHRAALSAGGTRLIGGRFPIPLCSRCRLYARIHEPRAFVRS